MDTFVMAVKKILQIITIQVAIVCAAPGAWARDPGAESRGFSGRVQAGAGYVTSTDQLDTDADKRLDGLSANADRFDSVIPLALFDLRYTFASGRQGYVSTPMESGGPPGLSLGVSRTSSPISPVAASASCSAASAG